MAFEANPRIYYTPNTIQKAVNFGTFDVHLVELAGGFASDLQLHVGVGGKSVGVSHDAWFEYLVQFTPLKFPWHTVTGAPTGGLGGLWLRLMDWIAHTQRGGLFDLRIDTDKNYEQTMTNAEAEGSTQLEMASTTGMEADDYLFLQHLDNPFKREYVIVDTVDSGTQVTLKRGTTWDYVAGSYIKARELFTDCIRLDAHRSPLIERRAGRGPVWDLRFRFRTTNG